MSDIRGSMTVVGEWPLVGRTEELRRLDDVLAGGRRHGVVVAGAAGVGKTRLAREFVRRAERQGRTGLWATATRTLAELPLGALAPLLPGSGPGPGAGDDRAWMLSRSGRALVERAGGRPLVLCVDDAHLLDHVSAALVHQLATTGEAFVLATVRPGEPAPDPVTALWKDGIGERMELGALEEAAVGELLSKALGGAVDPATVAELADRGRGNVLFLRELVEGALASGTLVEERGRWRLRGPVAPSDHLVELIDARLGGLEPAERELLELVSVGEPLGDAELATLGLRSLAESLERRGVLASQVSGRRLEVWLAHPLYGDVVRSRIPPDRIRVVARSLAETLERSGTRRREDRLRAASLWLAGGGGHPRTLLDGATEARWRCDFPLAERLARAALGVGAGFDAALLAAQMASLRGRTAQADRELAALAERTGDDRQRALVALARFDNSVTWKGADDTGILDAAEVGIAEPAWRDQIRARRAHHVVVTWGVRAGAEAAAPLLERAEGTPFVFACMSGCYCLARLGRCETADRLARRGAAVQLAGSVAVPWFSWWPARIRFLALSYAGRFAEAERVIVGAYREALAQRSPEATAVLGMTPGFVVGERGRLWTAVRRLRDATALHQQLDRPRLAGIYQVYEALALALAGQAGPAAATLAAVDRLGDAIGRNHLVDRLQARAWAAIAAGDLSGAHHHLGEAVGVGHDTGDAVGEAAALHGLARLGRAAEVGDRLAAVTGGPGSAGAGGAAADGDAGAAGAGRDGDSGSAGGTGVGAEGLGDLIRAGGIDGDLAPARLAHTRALAERDAAGLEEVSRHFEVMGADVLAAEAAAEAAGLRRDAGERRAATVAQRRSTVLAERCEGLSTPALRRVRGE